MVDEYGDDLEDPVVDDSRTRSESKEKLLGQTPSVGRKLRLRTCSHDRVE